MVHMIVLLSLLALSAGTGGFILGCQFSYGEGFYAALQLVKQRIEDAKKREEESLGAAH